MDSSKATCYLSFPDDPEGATAAARLRSDLEQRGVRVLPPTSDGVSTMSRSSVDWLRQADAIVLDLTGDTPWVAYEAGSAQALNKIIIPLDRASDPRSGIRWQLPRVFWYETRNVASVADYVMETLKRNLPSQI